MQEIDFYCRKCKKSMKMSYSLTRDENSLVLNGVKIRCHTNKCVRVVIFKKFTEGDITARADVNSRYYI